MSTTQIPLNDTDEEILAEIRENGRATVSLLGRILPVSEQYIRERVRRLREHDILIEVSPHLYDLYERRDEYEDKGLDLEA